MAIILILRVVILACIFLGGRLAIFATAGKEWQKYEFRSSTNAHTFKYGLWKYCEKWTPSYRERKPEYMSANDLSKTLNVFDEFAIYKPRIKGNIFFIGLIVVTIAFLVLKALFDAKILIETN